MTLAMPGKLIRRLVPCALAVMTVISLSAGPALAGYGPPGPPGGGPGPGGFNCVVTSRTVRPDGATIGPLQIGVLRVTVHIPPDTFPWPVQVTVTEPFSIFGLCQGGREPHIHGFHVIGGAGIFVERFGSPIEKFPHPISLSMQDVGRTDFSNLDVVNAADRVIIKLSGTHTRNPWKVSADSSTSWIVLADDQLPPPWLGRHDSPARHDQRAAGTGLTAALLPAGLQAPGLGVLTAPSGGLALAAGGRPADGR
jgi:hypothetical protein